MTVLNLSFAAAGFLGIYHIGAAEAFLYHGHKLMGSVKACAGASAGSMVAAALVTAPDKLEAAKDFMYVLADSVRQRRFGAVMPGQKLMHMLRDGVEAILPNEAHHLANERLHISVTDRKSGKNHIVSRFTSREELITALLASCYLPIYAGMKPVEFRGQEWIDGCFSDSLPILPVGRTVTISPFAGAQDICPVHRGYFSTPITLANMSIMLSAENLKRMCQSMIPPSPSCMQSFYEDGFNDAVKFLKREAWMSSQSDPLVKRTDDDEA